MRGEVETWADLKYDPDPRVEQIAHIVGYGDHRTLCNVSAVGFHGTGSFDEQERAHTVPTCATCSAVVVTGISGDPVWDDPWDFTAEGEGS